MAQLPQKVPFDSNGKLSSSFDSEAALRIAESSTTLGKCRAEAKALPSEKKREKALEDCYSERME